MKFLFPISIALLLGACAVTPVDKEAAHQRELWKQAHDNFIAMGGRDTSQPTAQPTPTPAAPLVAFQQPQPAAPSRPAPTPRVKSYAPSKPTPQPRVARNTDDTVYIWQVQSPGRSASTRDQAAEVRYARQLAKNPADLTPEERLYAHEHY